MPSLEQRSPRFPSHDNDTVFKYPSLMDEPSLFHDVTTASSKAPPRLEIPQQHTHALMTPPSTPSSSIRTSGTDDAVSVGTAATTVFDHDLEGGRSRFLLIGNIKRTIPHAVLKERISTALNYNVLQSSLSLSDSLSHLNLNNNSDESLLNGLYVRHVESRGIVILAFFNALYAQAARVYLSSSSSALEDLVDGGEDRWLSCQLVTAEMVMQLIGDSAFLQTADAGFYVALNGTPSGSEEEPGAIDQELRTLLESYGSVMTFEKQESSLYRVEYYDIRDTDPALSSIDGHFLFGMQVQVFAKTTNNAPPPVAYTPAPELPPFARDTTPISPAKYDLTPQPSFNYGATPQFYAQPPYFDQPPYFQFSTPPPPSMYPPVYNGGYEYENNGQWIYEQNHTAAQPTFIQMPPPQWPQYGTGIQSFPPSPVDDENTRPGRNSGPRLQPPSPPSPVSPSSSRKHPQYSVLHATSSVATGMRPAPIPERNVLDLGRIAEGLDTRTTVMIKNIPNKMSDRDLIEFIGKVVPRRIDFLYLRMDFQNACNVGYAFVNFIAVEDLLLFAQSRLGKKWNMYSSEKVLQMSYANYQGKEALVEKFKNSCIMDERESWKPKIFCSEPGPNQGMPEPFPSPTHLRRKERSSQNRGNLFGDEKRKGSVRR